MFQHGSSVCEVLNCVGCRLLHGPYQGVREAPRWRQCGVRKNQLGAWCLAVRLVMMLKHKRSSSDRPQQWLAMSLKLCHPRQTKESSSQADPARPSSPKHPLLLQVQNLCRRHVACRVSPRSHVTTRYPREFVLLPHRTAYDPGLQPHYFCRHRYTTPL